MIVKVSKKWRISHDEHNWIIQERIWGHKPPNNWVNKYFFAELKNVFTTLADLGIKDEKLTDFSGVLDRQRTINTLISHAIQDLAKQGGHKPPKTQRIRQVEKANKTRSKKTKGRASRKKGSKTKEK